MVTFEPGKPPRQLQRRDSQRVRTAASDTEQRESFNAREVGDRCDIVSRVAYPAARMWRVVVALC